MFFRLGYHPFVDLRDQPTNRLSLALFSTLPLFLSDEGVFFWFSTKRGHLALRKGSNGFLGVNPQKTG